jgi:hypothetical protein
MHKAIGTDEQLIYLATTKASPSFSQNRMRPSEEPAMLINNQHQMYMQNMVSMVLFKAVLLK